MGGAIMPYGIASPPVVRRRFLCRGLLLEFRPSSRRFSLILLSAALLAGVFASSLLWLRFPVLGVVLEVDGTGLLVLDFGFWRCCVWVV
ncbi:hypothetical protein A2U01_0083201, partial [Trifolium medium]|nr:hypothetical protein [Trifolium medium]